ncbi:transcriptional regulator [Paraliobacillus salinarum]|uniref:transcriptional regulator n=1 Tax=Paraliobacillus salinarum TaxID=1158996 RepID=UPI0015F78022|nr:transcriptional regulator [Paraliobacillus salinarum]
MATAIKVKKTTFKHIEAEWYNYHATLKEIANLREEIMYPMQEHEDINIVKGSNSVRQPGDPTQRIATRLTTNKRIKYLQEMVEAVETVYNALPDEYKNLVRIKYWSKSRLTWEGVALELNVSKRQAMRWRDGIIQATAEVIGWR